MLRQVKAEALKEVGPYGLPGTGGLPDRVGHGCGRGPGARSDCPGPGGQRGSPGRADVDDGPGRRAVERRPFPGVERDGQPGYSTTSDQEAGVDEPDMVKTNGQIMVVSCEQPLGAQVVDVRGPVPQLEGFLALPQLASAAGLFLVGQDVVVVGQMFEGPSLLPT